MINNFFYLIGLMLILHSCNFESSNKANGPVVSEAHVEDSSQNISGVSKSVSNSAASVSNMSTDDFRRKIIIDELTDYYRIYLYRAPDQAGLDFWSQHVFDKNITMTKAKDLIKKSDEARSVELPAEYQFYPPADHTESRCTYRDNGIEKTLTSSQGYVTRFERKSGSSYPQKAYYKENYSYYCEKQRVRCWAGQSRARVVKVKHILSRHSGCSEQVFKNRPENDRTYIKELASDVEEIYDFCNKRSPTKSEIDQTITSVVEQNGTIYDTASFLCGW